MFGEEKLLELSDLLVKQSTSPLIERSLTKSIEERIFPVQNIDFLGRSYQKALPRAETDEKIQDVCVLSGTPSANKPYSISTKPFCYFCPETLI